MQESHRTYIKQRGAQGYDFSGPQPLAGEHLGELPLRNSDLEPVLGRGHGFATFVDNLASCGSGERQRGL